MIAPWKIALFLGECMRLLERMHPLELTWIRSMACVKTASSCPTGRPEVRVQPILGLLAVGWGDEIQKTLGDHQN
jgi:hypothetical protein